MKLASVLLVSSVALLVGCGDSGGGSKSEFVNDYDTKSIPENPAPKAASSEFFSKMNSWGQVIPESDAYTASTDSSDQQKAKDKLSSKGREILQTIKAKCSPSENVDKKEAGEQGSTGYNRTTRSTSGRDCPLDVLEKKDSTTFYEKVEKTANAVAVIAHISSTTSNSVAVLDNALKSEVQFKSVKFDTKVSGTFSYSGGSSGANNLKTRADGVLNYEMTTSSGKVIIGKGVMDVISSQQGAEKTSKLRLKLDFALPEGNVRIIVKSDEGKEAEVYVNGERSDDTNLKMGMSLNN